MNRIEITTSVDSVDPELPTDRDGATAWEVRVGGRLVAEGTEPSLEAARREIEVQVEKASASNPE